MRGPLYRPRDSGMLLRLMDRQEQGASLDSPGAPACPRGPAWRRALGWWPLALPPLGIVAAYLARAAGWELLIEKGPHEVAALILLPIALAICAARWLIRRDRLHLMLTVLAAVLLCREIHFAGTHRGIYVAAGLIAAWAVLWRDALKKALWRTPKGRWLAVAMWAYVVAFLIQRRALKFLPDEDVLHVRLEEVSENVAHLLLLVASLV